MKIAVEYRQTFYKDIFVYIIGYRRFGHNNQDQPLFTQPMMYKEIA
jgi:2-oxoglutarate dehydrogenase E1 component